MSKNNFRDRLGITRAALVTSGILAMDGAMRPAGKVGLDEELKELLANFLRSRGLSEDDVLEAVGHADNLARGMNQPMLSDEEDDTSDPAKVKSEKELERLLKGGGEEPAEDETDAEAEASAHGYHTEADAKRRLSGKSGERRMAGDSFAKMFPEVARCGSDLSSGDRGDAGAGATFTPKTSHRSLKRIVAGDRKPSSSSAVDAAMRNVRRVRVGDF